MSEQIQRIIPGSFEAERHWYAKALNATIHPLVHYFLHLPTDLIINRYCHLHPKVNKNKLTQILKNQTSYFKWGGADLINVTTEGGKKQMVVIENNSCPSGQKSMPLLMDNVEEGSYIRLIEESFLPMISKRGKVKNAVVAVLYDKNYMETSGYAEVLANCLDEDVFLVPFYDGEWDQHARFNDGILEILIDGKWEKVRAAFRYVTQRPWNRIPVLTKTRIFNPVLACLAGGRNKMVAAKAYDMYNAQLRDSGLVINIPETIWDVSLHEVPLWIKRLGGHAVVKNPYSNAGQGVYTIMNDAELKDFMENAHNYDRFIVQSLIGNYEWSSLSSKGKLYHVGTMPNAKGLSFVADLRMMVCSTREGIRPLCVYARRARKPLMDKPTDEVSSWDMLGTNLSIRNEDGSWDSDSKRLLLMDRRDFNKLGIGVDDLIEAFIQTVLSMTSIDNMCKTLVNSKGKFRQRLFKSLNDDDALIHEIVV
ncbi:MAG: hypothetical protein R3275_02485 [Saprospiraceae bacterium]|nr:hypothetical protein [Saprospiraceae bacterium]